MMIERFLRQAAWILARLEPEGEARWRDLLTVMLAPSTWRGALEWLLRHEYVERPRRGLYRITPRGRELLEALKPLLGEEEAIMEPPEVEVD